MQDSGTGVVSSSWVWLEAEVLALRRPILPFLLIYFHEENTRSDTYTIRRFPYILHALHCLVYCENTHDKLTIIDTGMPKSSWLKQLTRFQFCRKKLSLKLCTRWAKEWCIRSWVVQKSDLELSKNCLWNERRVTSPFVSHPDFGSSFSCSIAFTFHFNLYFVGYTSVHCMFLSTRLSQLIA